MALSKVGLARVSHKLPDTHDTTACDAIVQSHISSQPASVSSHRHHKLSDARAKLGWRGGKETTTIRHATDTYDQTIPGQFMPQQHDNRKNKRRDTRDREEKEHRSKTGREPEGKKKARNTTRRHHKTQTTNTHHKQKQTQRANPARTNTQNKKRNGYVWNSAR